MKPLKKLITASAFCLSAMGFAQDTATAENAAYTGDNFSLEGALAMFKQASSPEEFEKLINQEGNNVNNLDLDNNGETDYVTVQDIVKGDTHVLVLSTFTDDKQRQDIATINIEKTGNERAILQIEGDKNLYADNTIVEPEGTKTTITNSKGPNGAIADAMPIVVNVWLWPAVRFIYAPAYVVYVSPWHFRTHPVWYRPWRPVHYNVFYTHCAPYRTYYRPAPIRRTYVAHTVYAPHRRTSAIVVSRGRHNNVAHNGSRSNYSNSRNYRTGSRSVSSSKTYSNSGRNSGNRVATTNSGTRKATHVRQSANFSNSGRSANNNISHNRETAGSINRTAPQGNSRSTNRIITSGSNNRTKVSEHSRERNTNRVSSRNTGHQGNERHNAEGGRGRRN